MASGRKRASKCGSKSVVFSENGKARTSNSTSINRFFALDENEIHKCAICDDLVAETEFLFNCLTCSLPIHPCCIDPDMPDDVIAYLCAGNAPGNFACYCHKFNSHPNNSMTHSAVSSVSNAGLLQLKKHLTSIENLLKRDRIPQPTVPNTYESTSKTKSGNDLSTPIGSSHYIASIQEEISEALEKERRKNNLIISNMSNQAEADDHNRL